MLTYDRILITGAAGRLGSHLRQTLKPLARSMRLTDVAPMDPPAAGEEVRSADLADEAAVFNLMEGVDAVVHLGGIAVEAPFADILRSNILGCYHVWEGARRVGRDAELRTDVVDETRCAHGGGAGLTRE